MRRAEEVTRHDWGDYDFTTVLFIVDYFITNGYA